MTWTKTSEATWMSASRRLIAAALLGLGAALAGCGDRGAEPAVKAVAATPAPAAPAGPVQDPAALVDAVGRAYREAPAIEDTITIVYETGSGPRSYSHAIGLGPNRTFYVDLDEYTFTGTGDRVFMTRAGVTHKYAAVPLGPDPEETMRTLTRGRNTPLHAGLRWAQDPQRIAAALCMWQLNNPRPTSMSKVQDERGTPVYELLIEGDNGTARVHVDAERMLVLKQQLNYTVNRGPVAQQMDVRLTYEPRVQQALARALTFDPAGRMEVQSAEALSRANVGEPAADFALQSLSGETVTLSQLRGNVVVLDYWATWCQPCRRGLPLLNQFHQWAQQGGHPVKVYAVNIWERIPTPEQKRQMVTQFWGQQGLEVPVLLDLADESVRPYGFSSIPTTVIIGPDGTVAAIHRGFDANMVQTLQAEVARLLRTG